MESDLHLPLATMVICVWRAIISVAEEFSSSVAGDLEFDCREDLQIFERIFRNSYTFWDTEMSGPLFTHISIFRDSVA